MIPTTFRLKPPPFACTPAGSLRSGPHLCRGGEFCKHPPHLCRRLETFRPGVAARMSRPSPQIRRSSASTSPPAPPGRTRHEGQFRVHRREAPVGNRLDLSPAGHAARPQGPRHQTEVGRGWIEILDKGMLLTLRGKAGEVEVGRGFSDATCPVLAVEHDTVLRQPRKRLLGMESRTSSDLDQVRKASPKVPCSAASWERARMFDRTACRERLQKAASTEKCPPG